MKKIAAIDAGTNTILLLIAEVEQNSLKVISDHHYIPRIGERVSETGLISPAKAELLNSIMVELKGIINQNNCDAVIAAGTNVYRKAKNAKEVLNKVEKESGIKINIIPGEEEARISYLGVVASKPEGRFLVIDIGGGSTELIYGSKREIKLKVSLPIGVVSLTERFNGKKMPSQEVTDYILSILQSEAKEFTEVVNDNVYPIAVAGTPTTLAAIKEKLKNYDEAAIEGSRLSQSELHEFAVTLGSLSAEEILKTYPVVKGREDVLTAGTVILYEICKYLNLTSVTVSTRGLRYGLVEDYIEKQSMPG